MNKKTPLSNSNQEKLGVFQGSAQEGLEPDYELLKRHLEVWAVNNQESMRNFLEYKKEVIRSNFKETGGFADNSGRRLMSIPDELYKLFYILAPNFVGGEELTPESQKKRAHLFLKHFPVFKMHEKT